jgi:hypothetical protein
MVIGYFLGIARRMSNSILQQSPFQSLASEAIILTTRVPDRFKNISLLPNIIPVPQCNKGTNVSTAAVTDVTATVIFICNVTPPLLSYGSVIVHHLCS